MMRRVGAALPRRSRLGLSICVIAAACFAANTASAAPTEARTALVIGNSGYSSSPLANPRNDARDLAKVLEQVGFEVEVVIDQNKEQMTEAIFEFGDRLQKRGGVGFFYYAGHGMEVDGENYLIPVGADIPSERYVNLRGVPMGEVTTGLAAARNKMNIVVLDACRNNPFARSWRSGSRGLAVMDAPAETLIAYATKPGDVAADGVGTRNSPYAQALIESIQEPGVRLVDVFRRARADVRKQTNGAQVPWQSDNLTSEAFYFIPPSGQTGPKLASVSPRPKADSAFSIDDLDKAARKEESTRREWTKRLEGMESAYLSVQTYEQRSVSDKLKVQAWERFARAYSEDDPFSPRDNQLRVQAKKRIDSLQPKYASLVVRSNVSGDQVSIDGRRVGSTGPQAHRVEPGRHVIKVEKSGYRAYEETIQVAAADRRVIAAELSKMIGTAARGMVRVPAGEFFSGCNEKFVSKCDQDEKPGRKRYVSAFAIDATEVTVEAYRECVRAGRCQEPHRGESCNWGRGDREVHPVNCVDWHRATAYCGWKGKRLPTEWEWEKAALGTDGRKYPWGNEQVSCRQAVIREGGAACGRGRTTFQVASKPLGVSPYGAHDMIGNVWEWTSSQYPGSTSRVVRGGSWDNYPGSARASNRFRFVPDVRDNLIGFRCAQ
jgi:formylglycine-generating enzyme required for sulfatase activity/uncharacterized caspase-like protein